MNRGTGTGARTARGSRPRAIDVRAVAAACLVGVIGVGAAQQVNPGVARNDAVPAALFTRPIIKTMPGFTATVLVGPGAMYDPLFVHPRPDGSIWVNDDGGVSGERGGVVWSIDTRGRVVPLVDAARMMPATGIDVAPPTFGNWGGQIFMVATKVVARVGVQQSHIIARVEPKGRRPSVTVCTLPDHGEIAKGVAAAGVEARFGPPKTPFANRFFSITIANNTIYQTTADGSCTPFATFDGSPWGLAFAPDGSKMYVTVRQGTKGLSGRPSAGVIQTVGPDGRIDPAPVFRHSTTAIFDVEVAPAGFGIYGGDLFFTDWGGAGGGGGEDGPPTWDGALYRVGRDGKPQLVASGFSNPAGIAFSGSSIWVADVNRDGPFYEKQWVADGFVVRIDLQKAQ